VTHDLPIDPALQSLLDASRAERDRRAANYPHVQRTAPHAAGRPLSPPTEFTNSQMLAEASEESI